MATAIKRPDARQPTRRMRKTVARSAIALGAIALAVPVVLNGVATRVERHNPILASQVAPYDARVAAAAARTAVTAGADERDPLVTHYVVGALSRDVTIPSAIEYRALAFGAAGDSARQA